MSNPIVLLVAALALQLPVAASARDPDAVISTGREKGSYYYIGERLKSAMLVEHDLRLEVLTSRGSLENLARLDDPLGPVGMALTQADALNRYLKKYPDFARQFIRLGDVGKECVFLIAAREDGLETAAGLKQDGARVSVDDAESGAAVTFAYMSQLEPGFRAAKPVPLDTMAALLELKQGGGRLAAAMIVQRPKRVSEPLRIVLENPDDYRLVPIKEEDVGNAELPDGGVVYSFERVTVGGRKRGRSLEVETLCTRGLLLASREKLSKDVQSQLSTLMLESSDIIIGEDE